MKRIVVLIVVAGLVFSLCSCGEIVIPTITPSTTAKISSGRLMDDLFVSIADPNMGTPKIEQVGNEFLFEVIIKGSLEDTLISGKADEDRFISSVIVERPADEKDIEFMESLTQKDFISYAVSDLSRVAFYKRQVLGFLITASQIASFCAGIDSSNNGAYLGMVESLLSAKNNEIIIDGWSYNFVLDSQKEKMSLEILFVGE